MESLLGRDIVSAACGVSHTIALSGEYANTNANTMQCISGEYQ